MTSPGDSEKANGKNESSTANGFEASTAAATTDSLESQPVMSNAEKKRIKQAEKAARRAKEKDIQVPVATPNGVSQGLANGVPATSSSQQPAKKQKVQEPPKVEPAERRRRTSTSAGTSAAGTHQLPVRGKATQVMEKESKPDKQVSFFAHLYGQPRQRSLEATAKEVHPAVAALALHLSSYHICGSHARGVAMLLALKSVIQSYSTPRGNSLPRHLATTFLSPQLTHLKLARSFSTTQANSIRWLKNVIVNIDPSVPEERAKADICLAIDNYIYEKFTAAKEVIADAASEHIQDNDVIVTFGKSTVVLSILLAAANRGTRFHVVVLDSRPLLEGKSLARALSSAGIEVQYSLANGLEHATKGATKCFLGAHAVLSNGRIYSRVGTASIAMMCKVKHASVIVCAESIKFTDRVALDSVVGNELAPEEELLGHPLQTSIDMSSWRDKDGLQILNPMFDVTPAEYVDVIITELGSLPASSAPSLYRISAGV